VAGCTNLSSSSSGSSPTTSLAGASASAQATVLPTAPPTNIQSYAGPFVGSKNSNVYHYPWCSEAKKIKPENLVTFATVADACAAGYRPCEVCNPPACNPTPTPTLAPTPITPTSTPTPKVCTHVEIIIFHPLGTPCNTCAMMSGMLGPYYANNPYVTISTQNATANSVVGIVRETGQTQSFAWGDVTQIEAWTDSVLTCK
jgi:hypothetical protein